jgi:hypothetical protein
MPESALILLGEFQTTVSETRAARGGRTWLTRATVTVAGAAIILSVFFAFVGVPYSQESIGEACSIATQCTQGMAMVTTGYVPTAWALVPLAAGGMVLLGIVTKQKVVSWAGTIVIAVFSAVSLASIGLLYLPLVPMLVGLLAAMPPVSKAQP